MKQVVKFVHQVTNAPPYHKKCGKHVYQLYFGGKKDKLVGQYFCWDCYLVVKTTDLTLERK